MKNKYSTDKIKVYATQLLPTEWLMYDSLYKTK